jgi:hypothetical protein
VVRGSACRAASWTSRKGTPASSAGHDERGAQQVRVDETEAGSFADRSHPAVSGASIEPLPVSTAQNRTFASLHQLQGR